MKFYKKNSNFGICAAAPPPSEAAPSFGGTPPPEEEHPNWVLKLVKSVNRNYGGNYLFRLNFKCSCTSYLRSVLYFMTEVEKMNKLIKSFEAYLVIWNLILGGLTLGFGWIDSNKNSKHT